MALSVMSERKGGKTETQLGTMVSGQVHGLARRTRCWSCLTDSCGSSNNSWVLWHGVINGERIVQGPLLSLFQGRKEGIGG
jgi:hypothetical protein